MYSISPTVNIPDSELNFSFARSGGPGGQNVNKVNSKAILRWSVVTTTSLPPGVHMRFLTKFGNRLTADGELVIASQRYRDQSSNMEDCLEKLREMVAAVWNPPVKRRPTKPSKGAKLRRAKAKSEQSSKKQQRRAPRVDD